MRQLSLRDGRQVQLPAFLPDGTRAVVRGVGADDLERVGLDCLMVNMLHLARRPGSRAIKRVGGVRRFMGWDGAVMSDSGGFQVHSLLRADSSLGSITDRGFSYRLDKKDKKRLLTPDKAIQKQAEIGADILFCLDDCGHPDDPPDVARARVDRTLKWARACKKAFDQRFRKVEDRPLLFGVVQGGSDLELRRRCALELAEIGFDGYGFGGWPVGADGQLVDEVSLVAELLPDDKPLHALGIGRPDSLVRAWSAGYHTFDCSLPTRDARRGRVFRFRAELDPSDPRAFWGDLDLRSDKFAADFTPIDEACDGICCTRYSRAYIHHLIRAEDPLAVRLATIHNLRFMTRLTDALRARAEI
jgi:queuine tRNA-ribosyltransferase